MTVKASSSLPPAMPYGKVKVKICGITSRMEAEFLNEAKADYAGFVFYEKSKRNVSLAEAKDISKTLSDQMIKVAVTVSPTLDFIRELEMLGFDLLQVHGELTQEVREHANLPIWRAVNISDEKELERFMEHEKAAGMEYIQGYVADGAGYGGGRPFDWEGLSKSVRRLTEGNAQATLDTHWGTRAMRQESRNTSQASLDTMRQERGNTRRASLDAIRQNQGKMLILAGGLTEENVTKGIRCFLPDVVDVSSSVEENGKKSRLKIENFIRKVREHG